jgi:hypothetical protein
MPEGDAELEDEGLPDELRQAFWSDEDNEPNDNEDE